jgi:hypothetical protein
VSRVRSTASFERVEEKQEEMSFFLDRLAEADGNPFVFRCYFSAFASAAMSVLYALDSARKVIDPDFAAWYEPRRLKLVEEDPTTSYVLARRREAVHIGETRIRSGSMHLGDNGEPIYKHFFSLHLGRPEPVAGDVLSACEHTHQAICSLVGEIPEAFPRVCPDYFMDADTLKREGLAVEDIEESLGLPRDWTFVEGYTDQQRLDALRTAI